MSMAKGRESLQLSDGGRDPSRVQRCFHKVGGLNQTKQKVGCALNPRRTLDFLNSVPCQRRKTGFSKAPSSGSCIKLGSRALLFSMLLAEGGLCEPPQSIWHGEQLSCTK